MSLIERARVPDGTAGQTYLVVRVREADPAVRAIAGDDALPAHVTGLGPFMPVDAITAEVAATIEQVVAVAMPWTTTFRDVRAFDDGTLWLAPDDDRPFRALTTELTARCPGYPPYGGVFDDVVPHLTLQERASLGPEAARNTLGPMVPITTSVDELELWRIHANGIEVVRRWAI